MTLWELLAYGWPLPILAPGHRHHRQRTRHRPPNN